jgi:hypothetical protein
MVGWLMDGVLETIWKQVVVAKPRYCPVICLKGLGKTVKDSGYPVIQPSFEPSFF